MCKLVCLLNLFTETQNIYLIDTDSGKSNIAATTTMDELSERIVDICDITKVNHVELFGAPAFSAAMADDIRMYARTKYNNNDIIVEVAQ